MLISTMFLGLDANLCSLLLFIEEMLQVLQNAFFNSPTAGKSFCSAVRPCSDGIMSPLTVQV